MLVLTRVNDGLEELILFLFLLQLGCLVLQANQFLKLNNDLHGLGLEHLLDLARVDSTR